MRAALTLQPVLCAVCDDDFVASDSSSLTDLPESERLRSLNATGILDTLPEQHYDDVAELASFICGTPISLVSFVADDRQWFKAEHGLGARQTPRSQSFCAHTIGTGRTLVVEDASEDPRFQNNPLVTGNPNIRFYAGAPILDDSGQVLGTVCVIDTVPRSLDARQTAALEALARQVTALLDQRRLSAASEQKTQRLLETRTELEKSEAQLTLAGEAAGIASWMYDPVSQLVVGDNLMTQLFGLDQREAPASAWIAAIHPEDRERVAREFAASLETGLYDTEYRLVPHHTTRWMRAKAKLLDDAQGQRLVGILEDVTVRRRTEEFLRQNAETIRLGAERLRLAQSAGRVAIFEWTLADGSFSWTDSHFAYGRPDSEVAHIDQIVPLLHPDDVADVMQRLQPAFGGTGEYSAEFRVFWPDGTVHWLQAFGKPVFLPNGQVSSVVGFNLDITERKRTEETLLRTEKLAAVGRLASSIAHEINNPLEAVTNLLYLARHSETLQEAQPFLETADLELRRAAAITNQTLRFHRQATRPTLVSFKDLVTGIFTGQRSRLQNAGITIQQRDRATEPILCFEGEIRQVLTNLIGNAIDSMNGSGGGTLYLRGRTTRDGDTNTNGLTITVADTGTGIPVAARAKLFDAFFTTKGIGGTGLGLWISKEILDRHHGKLEVRTREDATSHGTVFTIFLPAASSVQSASPAEAV